MANPCLTDIADDSTMALGLTDRVLGIVGLVRLADGESVGDRSGRSGWGMAENARHLADDAHNGGGVGGRSWRIVGTCALGRW